MNRVFAVLVCITVALGAGCASPAPAASATLPDQPAVGRLRKLDGKYLSLAALRGEAALITIIQTWSDYALVEIPLFNKVADQYGDRLTVLCIALDDQPQMVQIFVDTFKPEYEVVQVDDSARFTADSGPFGPITVIPTSVLLDAEGRIAARMDGTWRPDILRDAIEGVVGGPRQ